MSRDLNSNLAQLDGARMCLDVLRPREPTGQQLDLTRPTSIALD